MRHEIDLTAVGSMPVLEALPVHAIDGVLDAVVLATPLLDSGGRIVDFAVNHANESAVDVAGRRRDRLIGRSFSQLWPRMHGHELFRLCVRTMRIGEAFSVEDYEYVDEIDGRVVREVFDIRGSRINGELLLAWRIVTEQVQREWELRMHRQALEEAQRIGHLGTWFWDALSDGVVWSPEVYRIYGIPEGTPLRSTDTLAGLDAEGRRVIARTLESVVAGAVVDFEQRIVRPDGTRRILEVRAERVLGDKELVGIRGTTQDVTELRTAQAQLARERAAVEVLQGSILRRDLPDVEFALLAARYLPAASDVGVGGDWYDAFLLTDGRLALTVGDVVGHGVRAAELMGQLRNGLRMAVLSTEDPAAAIRQVDLLIAQTLPEAFATALVAIHNPLTGRFTWSRAGHLPPVIRRADRSVEVPEAGGRCPLGVEWHKPNVNADMTLRPGDSLVLYTDGLIERRGERLDVGLDRLAGAVAAARAVPDELCDRAIKECLFSGADADDVCILALVQK